MCLAPAERGAPMDNCRRLAVRYERKLYWYHAFCLFAVIL